jgi:hypothetical protein
MFSCRYVQSGDKAYVLCFVEFENAKHAFTALEALQGTLLLSKL